MKDRRRSAYDEIDDFADNPRTSWDGFRGSEDKRSFKRNDVFTFDDDGYEHFRTDVAHQLEHALVHDPDLVALRQEIYKKYGAHVYDMVFSTGDTSHAEIYPYEFKLEDSFVKGKENFIEDIRRSADLLSHNKKVDRDKRSTFAQKIKNRVTDVLRGFIPNRFALPIMERYQDPSLKRLKKETN